MEEKSNRELRAFSLRPIKRVETRECVVYALARPPPWFKHAPNFVLHAVQTHTHVHVLFPPTFLYISHTRTYTHFHM